MSDARTTELLEAGQGNSGGKAITGTSAVTPATGFYFTEITTVAATVVAAQTDYGVTNVDLTAFASIPAGVTIKGKWTSITLTSGEAFAINASK